MISAFIDFDDSVVENKDTLDLFINKLGIKDYIIISFLNIKLWFYDKTIDSFPIKFNEKYKQLLFDSLNENSEMYFQSETYYDVTTITVIFKDISFRLVLIPEQEFKNLKEQSITLYEDYEFNFKSSFNLSFNNIP